MKKMKFIAIPLVLSIALAGCSNAASSTETTTTVQETTTAAETTTADETENSPGETTEAETTEENDLTPETTRLTVGTVSVYDFDDVKLHVYATNDALGDYSFLLETADSLV